LIRISALKKIPKAQSLGIEFSCPALQVRFFFFPKKKELASALYLRGKNLDKLIESC
jgi:hypothetical protein